MMTISNMPLTARHWWLVAVASMEQIIGATLSTIVGIIIPLLNLFLHPELSAPLQGVMGAMGLIGIAVGSAVIGPLSDRQGYLVWFRVCPVLIMAGTGVVSLVPDAPVICAGLFLAGFGVGGGYSLDSAYISELMPDRWRSFMVGIAKASCAIGFILPAVIAVIILHCDPSATMWRSIVWVMGALGFATLLMRLRWAESPGWLMAHNRTQQAQKATRLFFGDGVECETPPRQSASSNPQKGGLRRLFTGTNLLRVIYSGIPWACEGLGVYGIGVFLPVLIMALGIDRTHAEGIPKIINSVELTAVINFCILPGFIIGLLLVKRLNNAMMMWVGFLGSALGMGLLLVAYLLEWAAWVSVVGFVVFEVLLNAGPHLITYIIPAAIYPVELRGTGSGVADFLGKAGAIIGVFFMPVMLRAGGMPLVLAVTIGVMLLGAAVSIVFSRKLHLN